MPFNDLPPVPRSEVLRLVQAVLPSLLSDIHNSKDTGSRIQSIAVLFTILACVPIEVS